MKNNFVNKKDLNTVRNKRYHDKSYSNRLKVSQSCINFNVKNDEFNNSMLFYDNINRYKKAISEINLKHTKITNDIKSNIKLVMNIKKSIL